MRRLAWLFVFLLALPSAGQSYPDVEALLDLIFAKDAAAISAYLPVELLKTLQQFPEKDQLEFKRSLLSLEELKAEEVEIIRSTQLPLLIEVRDKNKPDRPGATISLDKRISNGYESLLRIRLKTPEKISWFGDITALVWMRFEEGQWRFVEFQCTEESDHINLDDPKTMEEFRTRHANQNEVAALTMLRQIGASLTAYAAKYPTAGFPSALDVLACSHPSPPTSQRSCLLALPLTNGPYAQGGYTFTYRPLLQSGPTRYFSLVARPDTFGLSGVRSFSTDETGTIRYTEEDREAAISDPSLR